MSAPWRSSHLPWRLARWKGELRPKEALQDNEECVFACYLWGTKDSILLDCLCLGGSHDIHGSKIKRVLCAHAETRNSDVGKLLRAFWKIKDVEPLELPHHLEGTEQARLAGVYSKLQCFKVFAEKPDKFSRVCMMDADMILNKNIEKVFSVQPPARVMRGKADTCLHDKRPKSTFFQEGKEETFTKDQRKMKGGINGGLVLFRPDVTEFQSMQEELVKFRTPTTTTTTTTATTTTTTTTKDDGWFDDISSLFLSLCVGGLDS